MPVSGRFDIDNAVDHSDPLRGSLWRGEEAPAVSVDAGAVMAMANTCPRGQLNDD